MKTKNSECIFQIKGRFFKKKFYSIPSNDLKVYSIETNKINLKQNHAKRLLIISVLLVARTSGFLVNPGDATELLAEIGQLREAVSALTNQVRSSCGCASTMAPRCPDGWTMLNKIKNKINPVTILASFQRPGKTPKLPARS